MKEYEGRVEIHLYKAKLGVDQRSRAAWELQVLNQKDYESFDFAKDVVDSWTDRIFVKEESAP